MAHVPTGIITHSQKVCSLYKRILREVESWVVHLDELRYQSVLIRAKFDACKNVSDLREAKKLLQAAEKELSDCRHYSPKKFSASPGGSSYERYPEPPDWVLDYWHPMEKAMYPKYFACREHRKLEYEEFYKQEYAGKCKE